MRARANFPDFWRARLPFHDYRRTPGQISGREIAPKVLSVDARSAGQFTIGSIAVKVPATESIYEGAAYYDLSFFYKTSVP